MGNEVTIRRRHLPHWTIDGAVYFVTFRSIRILKESERIIVLDHIKSGDGKFYTLISSVIMPDHAHILIHPLPPYTLSRIMMGIKGVSAHLLNLNRNTRGNVWQHESYDRIVGTQYSLNRIINYIAKNPVKAGLSETAEGYSGWYCNSDAAVRVFNL